jgi:hypothetical protein
MKPRRSGVVSAGAELMIFPRPNYERDEPNPTDRISRRPINGANALKDFFEKI